MTDWDESGTPGMDDRALVAAHVAGDPEAFGRGLAGQLEALGARAILAELPAH